MSSLSGVSGASSPWSSMGGSSAQCLGARRRHERAAGDLKAMLASLMSAMQPTPDSVQAGAAQSASSLIA